MAVLLSILPWLLVAVGVVALASSLFPQLMPASGPDAVRAAQDQTVTAEPATGEILRDTFIRRGGRTTIGVLLTAFGGALFLDLDWMQWTSATAAFFVGLFSLLIVMTVWDILQPTGHPQGFMPIPFSRGERLFLSFMIFFGVVGLWIAFLPEVTLWGAIGLALVLIIVMARWG